MCMAVFVGYSQVINSYPHLEDFETEIQCPTGCGPTCNLVGSWRNPGQWGLTAANVQWTSDVGGTGSFGTGPSVDHTTGTGTGTYVYMETSCNGTGYPNQTAELVSTYYDFTSLTAPQMTFWRHMFGTSGGTLHVDVDTTQGTGAWVTDVIPSIANPNLDQWIEQAVDLTAFAGQDSVRIRIREVSGTSFTCDFGIDDINVFQPEPYDLAGLGFITSSCGLGAQPVIVEYQNAGTDTLFVGDTVIFDYNDGTTMMTDTVILTSPLAPTDTLEHTFSGTVNYVLNTPINMQVWSTHSSDASNGNDTIWTTINPIPVIDTYPYIEDYEAGTGGWNADNTNNGTWEFGTPNKTVIIGAASGDSAWVAGGLTGDYSANDNSWVDGPCFDMTTLDTGAHVGLNVWWNSEFSWDGANLSYSMDDGNSWTLIGAFNDPDNWYNDNTINGNPNGFGEGWTGRNSTNNGSGGWVRAKHQLPDTLIGQPNVRLRVAFGSDGSVQDDGFAFDDFVIAMPDSLDTAYADFSGCAPFAPTYTTAINSGLGKYEWFVQDTSTLVVTPVDTTTTGSYVFTNTGTADTTFNMIVQYTDIVGCMSSDTVLVTLQPTPYNELADTAICFDGSAMFHVDTAAWYTYSWSNNGSTVDSASYTVGGMITVTVTDTISGCSHDASAMIYQTPAVDITLATINVCAGDSVMIDAGTGYATYAWSNGDSTQTTYVSNVGWYSVMTADSIGCMSSDSIEVTTSMPMPSITGGQDTLCDYNSLTLDAGAGFSSYSWSTGGTSQNETVAGSSLPAGSNDIIVTVTDDNGCENTDTTTVFIDGCAGVSELAGVELSIFPNPSNGEFNYEIGDMPGDIEMTVTDMAGKIITQATITEKTGTIDLSGHENGVYVLKLKAGDAESSIRLVKK